MAADLLNAQHPCTTSHAHSTVMLSKCDSSKEKTRGCGSFGVLRPVNRDSYVRVIDQRREKKRKGEK